jgi:formylglycine-generating enzyme required for sulfatase activity
MAFCEALTEREEHLGRYYELPTELEWEYACRAGTATPYHFGNSLDPAKANVSATGWGRPVHVGSFPPNAWGLFDMHGNVWEWTKERYYDEERKGEGTRILRGGGYASSSNDCRAAYRLRVSDTSYPAGFRVVMRLGSRPAVLKPSPMDKTDGTKTDKSKEPDKTDKSREPDDGDKKK